MNIILVKDKISKDQTEKIAQETFVSMVKAVVDLEQSIIALGGELHADEEAVLLEHGSQQKDLWGINIYLDRPVEQRIEFVSLINIRPAAGLKSLEIEDPNTRQKITEIINKLIE